MERLKRVADHDTIVFMKRAINNGAHNRINEGNPFITPQEEARNRNITGIYYGTEMTLGDVGNMYGLTAERVRVIVKETLIKMHNASSPAIKKDFPLEDMNFGKVFSSKVA